MPIVVDGAMGTQLAARGFDLTAGSAAANRDAPELVTAIHRASLHAGAQVLTTNTFALLAADGVQAAVDRVREAIAELPPATASQIRIAGSIGALGRRCAGPTAPVYLALAHALLRAGCDLIVVETIIDVADARQAIAAVGGPVHRAGRALWISVACGRDGRLLGEGSLSSLPTRGVDAIIIGCTEGEHLAPALTALPVPDPTEARRPWVGLAPSTAATIDGVLHPDAADPRTLAQTVATLAAGGGIEIVGGCCGTTAAFTAELAARVHPTPSARAAAFAALDSHCGGRV